MTSDPESADLESRENPYAAPAFERTSSEISDESARALRLAYLGRETAIRRVAWINLVCAILWVFPTVGSLLVVLLIGLRAMNADIAPSLDLPPPALFGGVMGLVAVSNVCLLGFWIALFIGLRSLQSWARWTMVGLDLLVLFGVCFIACGQFIGLAKPTIGDIAVMNLTGGLFGFMLYVLISPPSGRVFTRLYREAVARTRGMAF